MANFETGYPSTRNVVNQAAYDLGCRLLDAQDRLLVFHKKKRVRRLLQLDMPRQITYLFDLSWSLQRLVWGTPDPGQTMEVMESRVNTWIRMMDELTVALRPKARTRNVSTRKARSRKFAAR